jgi:hypothetical protein
MLQPPVFNSQEEVDAYLDVVGGGAVGVAEGVGIIDLLAGVPWLARETAGQQVLSTMLRERDRLERHTDDKTADYFQRLDLRSKGVLGNEKSPKIALNTIAGRSGTYDDAIENTLESLGYNKTEQSEVARRVAFLTTLGIDLAFLTKVIIQNAPRGYRAVRDALKNMGKNVDEADQAVMKAEMETGMSQTPVQMEMDLAAPKAKPVQNTQEQAYNLETRLYDLNNVIRQEGGVMSKTNLQKINKEINEIQSKLNKLQGYKNGGIVQNSVDYALEQWT